MHPFFAAALGCEPLGDADAAEPLRCGPQLAFTPITGANVSRGRTHFDILAPADGAQAPAWWSLASPDNHGVDIASGTASIE